MITDLNKKFQKELNSGITALVLLAVMEQATEPLYGYQIAKTLEEKNEDMILKQGALYPVLRSLESGGMLDSHVDPSVSGPPRRYYRITELGSNTLFEWKEIWAKTRDFIENILQGENNDI